MLRRFEPLAADVVTTPSSSLVDLGRMLYFEPKLSSTRLVSCASCHPLDQYGTTNEPVSTGTGKGTRNAPTTYHAFGHFRQFWDGRAESIEEQAKGPMLNPREMGATPESIVTTLAGVSGYAVPFALAFPAESQPITFDNVAKAIGAFERGLSTPSRWDLYLRGEQTALTRAEKDGAKLFANLGCMGCHTGAYLGGSMFEKVGVKVPWPNQSDRGRGAFTKLAADDMVFKVPGLRNVARTAPYFHDGSAATLDQAVRLMGVHQLGEELTDEEVRSIVDWLGSLTGDLPSRYIAAPVLP